mgnify:FL=1
MSENASRFRDNSIELDNWAIVGDVARVRDKLAEYEETLGLNYLIARGRIEGVNNDEQIKSHELLLQAAN